MHLTPREKDKLLMAMAAEVARRRRARGIRLNHPEAVALISDVVVEGARDGRSVAELMQAGAEVLTTADVMPGIAAMIPEIQVEATFPDGVKLVLAHLDRIDDMSRDQALRWAKLSADWLDVKVGESELSGRVLGD